MTNRNKNVSGSRPGAKARFKWTAETEDLNEKLNDALRYLASSSTSPTAMGKIQNLLREAEMAAKRSPIKTNPSIYEEIRKAIDNLGRAPNSLIADYLRTAQGRAFYLFSRPGAKARFAVEDRFYFGQPERFENAPWMPEVNRMLRDLSRERAKIKIWISGSDSVTTSGSSRGYSIRDMGSTWIIASRIANYLKDAVPQSSMAITEKNDYPKKRLTTVFYKVSNLPKELIAYLKNWGVSTSPGSFSGFTGESAVRYARPGQPERFDASSLERGNFAEASKSPMLGKLLAAKAMPDGGWRAVQAGSDTLVISFEDADLARDFGRRVASKGYSATSPVATTGRYWNVEVKHEQH